MYYIFQHLGNENVVEKQHRSSFRQGKEATKKQDFAVPVESQEEEGVKEKEDNYEK